MKRFNISPRASDAIKSVDHFGSKQENPEAYRELSVIARELKLTLSDGTLYAYDEDGYPTEFKKVLNGIGIHPDNLSASTLLKAGFKKVKSGSFTTFVDAERGLAVSLSDGDEINEGVKPALRKPISLRPLNSKSNDYDADEFSPACVYVVFSKELSESAEIAEEMDLLKELLVQREILESLKRTVVGTDEELENVIDLLNTMKINYAGSGGDELDVFFTDQAQFDKVKNFMQQNPAKFKSAEFLEEGMSAAAKAADTEQSDREYIAQRQKRAAKQKFSAGDTVKLKPALDKKVKSMCPPGRENNATSTIQTYLDDIPGGIFLTKDLRGIKYWNEVDLELVKKA